MDGPTLALSERPRRFPGWAWSRSVLDDSYSLLKLQGLDDDWFGCAVCAAPAPYLLSLL